MKNPQDEYIRKLLDKFHDLSQKVEIPPPVYNFMQGEIQEYDLKKGMIKVCFPLSPQYANPFGNVQGGIIAAAIDNTLGPLSMLVAPKNFTRSLEVKYKIPINVQTSEIYVIGNFKSRKNRRLEFSANVIDCKNKEYAEAKAIHWIVI